MPVIFLGSAYECVLKVLAFYLSTIFLFLENFAKEEIKSGVHKKRAYKREIDESDESDSKNLEKNGKNMRCMKLLVPLSIYNNFFLYKSLVFSLSINCLQIF